MGKLVSLAEAARICKNAKASGKKAVLCTGSFDLLHFGHLYSLQSARKFGDVLIVGLNSDKSYEIYKDKRGPVFSQKARAAMLCALSCVDYVVLFDEPDPIRLILTLKPSIYANGAYYGKDCIEAQAVKKAGSQLKPIPILKGFSATNSMRKIAERYSTPKKAVFLDRDGVLIKDVGYAHKASQIEFIPGIIKKLKDYQNSGYSLVVVSNQSGVARGYFGEKDVVKFNNALKKKLKAKGISLLDIYYCPHHPDGIVKKYSKVCECRKPRTGMLEKAKKEHNIDLSKSIMIGDKESDIEAGKRAGLKKVLLSK